MAQAYVDADGHVMENAEDLLTFVKAPFNNRGTRNWMPSLDNFHTPADGTPRTPGTFDPNTGPEEWLEFLGKTRTGHTVAYPPPRLGYRHRRRSAVGAGLRPRLQRLHSQTLLAAQCEVAGGVADSDAACRRCGQGTAPFGAGSRFHWRDDSVQRSDAPRESRRVLAYL